MDRLRVAKNKDIPMEKKEKKKQTNRQMAMPQELINKQRTQTSTVK